MQAEFKELVRSAGCKAQGWISCQRHQPSAKYFVGEGKAEEIKQAVVESDAELVVFNHDLTPSQERNLEKLIGCRILDRTGLILDIFAQRARTHEGKLQVELAQLKHMSTRLDAHVSALLSRWFPLLATQMPANPPCLIV